MKKKIKFIFSVLISLIFLYLSMKDVQFSKVWESLKKMKYYYIIFVVLISYLSYVIRTVRWQILLHPLKKTSYSNLFPTLCVSFMLLIILPARLGEFARAYLVGVKENISKTGAFSTIVVERILDGCITVLLFILAVFLSVESSNILITQISPKSEFIQKIFSLFASKTTMPDGKTVINFTLINFIYYVSFFYGGALLFVIFLKIFGTKMINFLISVLFFIPEKIKKILSQFLNSFIIGLNSLSNFKSILFSLLYSVILWLLIGTMNYIFLLSFGIECRFYIAFIILGFMILGVMIPAAPGFIGTYHWVIMLAFKFYLPEVDPNVAASYAWAAWSIGTVFALAIGFYYFKRENLDLKELQNSSNN
ncbi:flippase-like domain-containing protein [Candidatus Dependentiae bacterium]|nr:flippase-like domain-containing protein [Candidatus Dependentiae bacterium]